MRRKPGGITESTEREPSESENPAFARLFEDAYRRCFSTAFTAPLTESESHRLSVEIAESTGLEIGWKSLKNYSHFLLGRTSRVENPSIATLDTLARYVAGAPPTDEERRRTRERHYPYWVRYKEGLRRAEPQPTHEGPDETRPSTDAARDGPQTHRSLVATEPSLLTSPALRHSRSCSRFSSSRFVRRDARSSRFADEFDDVSAAALAERGWSVHSIDSAHWAQRGAKPGHLTLFTLAGDNWPQPGRTPVIRNLLVRPDRRECFVADVRLTSFFPRQNWQQAGLLLLEDTTFAGRSVRMSLGFNDFSGGFPATKEDHRSGDHLARTGIQQARGVAFINGCSSWTPPRSSLVRENLESSALRIEKRGAHLRLSVVRWSDEERAVQGGGPRRVRLSARVRGGVRHQGVRGQIGRRARVRRRVQPVGVAVLAVSVVAFTSSAFHPSLGFMPWERQ